MGDNELPEGFSVDVASAAPPRDLPSGFQLDEEKYGSTGQQVLTGLEGAAQGVIGPFAPAIERGLGVKLEDIRGRREENPVSHGLGEAVGFGGSLLSGVGEAAVIGKVGETALQASKLGLEGASTISKIAAHGVQAGAEMAALQSGDEISKMITQDPEQSLGTAAVNIGLSGIIGGAGGAILGSVSPLWKSASEKAGAPKIIDQAKAQYEFRKSLPGGDVSSAITNELTTRMAEIDAIKESPFLQSASEKVQEKVASILEKAEKAEKDAASKFTSPVLGERVADPSKVNTLVNQSLKGRAGLKTNVMENYLEHTEALADSLNKLHLDEGLEAPIRLSPTPAIDQTLGNSSPGTDLGNWLYDKGLASVAGHLSAEGVGAGLGSLIGHPAFGAYAGEKLLAPMFTSLAKPLLENASRAEAFKGSLDYVASVIKGEKLLNKATEGFFKSGAELLSKDLMPNEKSREKLSKSLEHASNFDNAMKIGEGVRHYLPNHASAAAALSAKASQYLNTLKPTQPQMSPLDKPNPVDPGKQAAYNRALDIAQQPLLVLEHAKKGTLQAKDVQTLNTLYPGLHSKIVGKLYDQMMESLHAGRQVPYRERLGLSLLMGKALDSSLTPGSMQAVIMSNASPAPAAQGSPKVTKSTPTSMSKVNSLYATTSQARAAGRQKI